MAGACYILHTKKPKAPLDAGLFIVFFTSFMPNQLIFRKYEV